MSDQYKTIIKPSQGEIFKDKGSKFIGLAFPVTNPEEVKQALEQARQSYHDARHCCYAYRIGHGPDEIYRANDDGEPNNSAGMPIYNQLLSFEVTDVLVVVVRYFGGTKLGVSGLINAYKTAAKLSLSEAKIVEKYITKQLTLSFPYSSTSLAMKMINQADVKIIDQKMSDHCELTLLIRSSKSEDFKSRISATKNISILES